MKLALDTNVFTNMEFCHWLRREGVEKVIPCVAYLELVYHHLKRGRNVEYTDTFLELHGIQVIPLDSEIAKITAQSAVGRWDFREKARDYTIGATAISCDAKLVTYNKRDFEWLPSGMVASPEEVM
ncbi:MAG: type II toxin-antitoxin system VapC family toxin [Candidatus Bathyarchaeia archaeon]